MAIRNVSRAKEASVISITAAVYSVLFFLSGFVTLPGFTILYLPVIVLGVFPLWFGWAGLAGSTIGAFVGGALVEGLGLTGVIESVTALIIYGLNWLLIPKKTIEGGTEKNLLILFPVYAVTLFAGTSYIFWQYTILGVLNAGVAELFFLPTFGLNLAIQWVVCPVLITRLTPRLKRLGIYIGSNE